MPELTPHDKAMADKVDAAGASLAAQATPMGGTPPATPATPQPPARPDHIPEKFWDAATGTVRTDELAKAYKELETRQATTPPTPAENPPVDASRPPEGTPSGIDFETYSAEFAKNGSLSEDSYKALEAKGIPKTVVDTFIANQRAAADAAASSAAAEAFTLAGGEQAYGSMLDWAARNLPQAEQDAFDKAVTGDAASRKQAIVALKAQYAAAMGSDPKLLGGQGQPVGGEGAFQSRAEVTAAMRDPRYKTDPAYRASVERRVGAMAVF